MILDSLPDLDTSGLCLVKTLSTALTCWPYRNPALRDGARTSTRTSSVAKGRTASIRCRPALPSVELESGIVFVQEVSLRRIDDVPKITMLAHLRCDAREIDAADIRPPEVHWWERR